MKRVAVVICTYSRSRSGDLRRAVASVAAQQGVEVELVVVVDHNPELQAELEAELGAGAANGNASAGRGDAGAVSDVKVVSNTGVRGLSDARNSGVRAATTELVAFLDDDAAAEPSWLAELVTVLEGQAAQLVGGTVLPALEGERPGWWPQEFDWAVGCSYPGQIQDHAYPASTGSVPEAVRVRNAIGASMLARREALLAAGGFSTALGRVGTIPVGGEETELSIRLAAEHGPDAIWLATRSVVHHTVPAARLTISYLHRRCYAEGLSKAVLGRLAPGGAALSSESRYLLTTLPRGVWRHLAAILRGDLGGLARAGVLVSATAATAFGWVRGRLAPADKPAAVPAEAT